MTVHGLSHPGPPRADRLQSGQAVQAKNAYGAGKTTTMRFILEHDRASPTIKGAAGFPRSRA